MEKFVYALLEHKLTVQEILELPEVLNKHSSEDFAGEWEWTSHDMDIDFLNKLWSKEGIDAAHSTEDLALLQKDNMTIDFTSAHLITFDNLILWDSYNNDDSVRNEFNNQVKILSSSINAIDLVIVPDLYSLPFFDEHTVLTVDSLRQKAGNDKNLIQGLK